MIRSRPFRLTLLASALAFSSPVLAQDSETGATADPRLVTKVFDETKVYTIKGKVKVQTTIKFAPDETIQNVAIGDSTAWQVQPNQAQSLLFVKPLAVSAATNMTVVTSRRTYLFDLDASPRNAPLYVLQFRYPELERAAVEANLAAAAKAEQDRANALELAAASDPYAVVDPARLNFNWATDGKSDLFPERTYDDGEATFLTWAEGTSIPAILTTNEEGDEGPVNFTVRGETVVLDTVPLQIVLRAGKDSATLTNLAPAAARSASAVTDRGRGS